MAKIVPAELAITFKLPAASNPTTNYIDLAQCLSAVNRRLYRQGKMYYLSGVQLTAPSVGMAINTIPKTWVTTNAWVKAFNLWKEMQSSVLDTNPSVAGKWRDFKVYMSNNHYNNGVGSNLIPVDADNNDVLIGEWNMSTCVLPEDAAGANDEFELHMCGDDVGGPLPAALGSGGILKMYEDTRAHPQNQTPGVPADMPLSWGTQLIDDGRQDPELATRIDQENDNAPYDIDHYPGAAANFDGMTSQMLLTTTTEVPIATRGGFCAPLGLLEIVHGRTTDQVSGEGNLTLYFMPGEYRGVAATGVKQ